MAVDDDADTYWASKFDDTKAPVEYVVDFGEVQKLSSMELSWEFPARSFAVSASLDGEHFTDVYATDANVLKNSRISLGGASARKLRISMLEVRGLRFAPWRSSAASPRSMLILSFSSLVAFMIASFLCSLTPFTGGWSSAKFVRVCICETLVIVLCRFQGHLLYGIRSLAVFADRLRSVVSGCSKIAKSSDARDKYFLSHIGEFDPFPIKALRSELPAVDAARASLAATVSELSNVTPQLGLCRSGALSSARPLVPVEVGQGLGASLARSGGVANGLDVAELDALLVEARSSIVGVRSVLA